VRLLLDYGFRVYIGTYTSGTSRGIYVGSLNLDSGALHLSDQSTYTENPSYLAVHPNARFLYSVNETTEYKGRVSGSVSSFAINPTDGGLTLINQQPTLGAQPCYISLDRFNKYLLVANYAGGSTSVLPISPDGGLGEPSGHIQYHETLETVTHPHCIIVDSRNYVFTPDLGANKIMIHKLSRVDGTLTPNKISHADTAPGAGPRHMAFHPNEKYAYVINELGSSITVFHWDHVAGILSEVETITTLPPGHKADNTGADIHVHPSGKFVYASNRGHDSIAIYAVSENGRKLTLRAHEPTQGKSPRGFVIDPTGTILLVANQESNTVIAFRINPNTGKLRPTGSVNEMPSPACIKVIPLAT
jgi:6-phosphogluconolactonase